MPAMFQQITSNKSGMKTTATGIEMIQKVVKCVSYTLCPEKI